MIVDSSAVLAILFGEADARRHASAIMAAYPCRMSVANVLEASIALERRGGATAAHDLDALLERAEIELVPSRWNTWRRPAVRGGASAKGNHPAALNFGDCFAYALARATGEPLLFKGGDFSQTDIEAA